MKTTKSRIFFASMRGNPYSSSSITHDGRKAFDSLAIKGEMSTLYSGVIFF